MSGALVQLWAFGNQAAGSHRVQHRYVWFSRAPIQLHSLKPFFGHVLVLSPDDLMISYGPRHVILCLEMCFPKRDAWSLCYVAVNTGPDLYRGGGDYTGDFF